MRAINRTRGENFLGVHVWGLPGLVSSVSLPPFYTGLEPPRCKFQLPHHAVSSRMFCMPEQGHLRRGDRGACTVTGDDTLLIFTQRSFFAQGRKRSSYWQRSPSGRPCWISSGVPVSAPSGLSAAAAAPKSQRGLRVSFQLCLDGPHTRSAV